VVCDLSVDIHHEFEDALTWNEIRLHSAYGGKQASRPNSYARSLQDDSHLFRLEISDAITPGR
jgi:hypothetical protein